MTIALPNSPAPSEPSTPLLRQFGGVLTPFLGGPEQLINRLGTRFGIRLVMPPMVASTDGRIFVARLVQAKSDRLLMRWPLDGFEPGNPGAPKVSAAATGSVLPLKGLTASYGVKEGQFFSIIHGGRRYLHMFAADGSASVDGTLSALIFPMLRVVVSADDVVEIAQPMIEGHVQPGEELSWQISLARRISLSFSVLEAA
ncbi:MAG TPA: hypothetical protein VF503_01360 [Sphingobium sp.]|uniref:hypothetical protein n=1 Tax=Sphingobium sp. TaxID=1912891 RepID=UPI002ED34DB3